ncbi:pyridoxamine 5'-phosphate oxidase family protein [Plastoroseomonas hellenica]|uniref:pyridoxamine 5'-phosphate oxidase family protein n=1 Tax=Plastoroseomonas hellenica TaxID=2687306 RepID=UPI001BA7BABE|nr:pyridoxamine 5'-phosphate oxidase family protein [Plastoroseomonas hellenica]MBR0647887.1 pyridoxamine 5-phosphate oxidase [Plastoroseomonas hellenica]
MGRHYAEIAFTPAVQAEQTRIGSRSRYERVARDGREDGQLGPDETAFIAARDSVYMASVSETGWPYLQHRGGPPGFLRVLSPTQLGFADLVGNRQHVSVGNLAGDDRVALFLMDYPARRRLKILGHARVVREGEDAALVADLAPPGLEDRAERAILIDIAGFEWNCPQHITPRYTAAELAPLVARLETAEAELAELRAAQRTGGEP